MDTRVVFTEQPEDEQWSYLNEFSYASNILKYGSENSIHHTIEDIDSIISSINQSQEYFKLSKISSVHISPLLLYYGTVNLLSALTTLTGRGNNEVKSHGMTINIPNGRSQLADVEIEVRNGKGSGLLEYSELFNSKAEIENTGSWSLGEVLSSIPDLYYDYVDKYDNRRKHLMPIKIIHKNGIEHHEILIEHHRGLITLDSGFDIVCGFSDSYIHPQIRNNGDLILRKRIDYEDFSVSDLFGRRYLKIGHTKNSTQRDPPVGIHFLIALYILGNISRYHPKIWHPFISGDKTGEKSIIEKFLNISRRIMPNVAVNMIEKKNVVYTNSRIESVNKPHLSEEEIGKMIEERLKGEFIKRGMQ